MQPYSALNTTGSVSPESFLWKLIQKAPLVTSRGTTMSRTLPFRKWDLAAHRWEPTNALIVSLDNGNDAMKGAIQHASQPYLTTARATTAYAPARTIRAGEGITTWQVNDSEQFWFGEDAFSAKKVEALPVGFTAERIPDDRYQAFLAGFLVHLLIEAGYGQRDEQGILLGEEQGEYNLYCSFGVPNEELSLSGVKQEVAAALRMIFNVPFDVTRTDERGHVTHWRVRLVEISPYPQTFGSFAAWYYTCDGSPIETSIVKQITLDIGGGQFHSCEVDLAHKPDGTVKLRIRPGSWKKVPSLSPEAFVTRSENGSGGYGSVMPPLNGL
jgi:hypothetical protein